MLLVSIRLLAKFGSSLNEYSAAGDGRTKQSASDGAHMNEKGMKAFRWSLEGREVGG
jgi:hypothetical protein